MVELVHNVEPVRVKCLVKWFNENKGFGFLVAEGFNRDIFVHRQQLIRSGLTSLTEGETVSCVVNEGHKGMYATQIAKEDGNAGRPNKN